MTDNMVVAVFPSRKKLLRALDHLMEQSVVDIQRASVVSRAENGETIVMGDDLSPDEGGIAGSVLGAAIGVLGMAQLGALTLPGIGPIIVLGTGILLGGVLGRMTGRFAADIFDFSLTDDLLDLFTQQLQSGHSALVLQLCEDHTKSLPTLQDVLKPFGVEFIETLKTATTKQPPAHLA